MSNKQDRAFSSFYDCARNNRILDQNTTLMIHLTTALSVGCVS
jgi:hypothetical protein